MEPAKLKWFQPSTFENLVLYRGQLVRNMPMLSGVDSFALRAGDWVSVWETSKGPMVLGRWWL